ncbi:hypothetical protein K435DRAFT_962885 [Dendrothele bispora CBS 962.96]|uniref:Uncharacterized protein n=1 Tax=Dendrothele bispora (strain CBS 962.96) TaxID=1314807 RepID=A0A4S8MJ08_DENBC|nr:hypothetical protein K435DRAFT_962885 [Dendrothele bispora CBS 962.96]
MQGMPLSLIFYHLSMILSFVRPTVRRARKLTSWYLCLCLVCLSSNRPFFTAKCLIFMAPIMSDLRLENVIGLVLDCL